MARTININTAFVLFILFLLAIVFFFQVNDAISGASVVSVASVYPNADDGSTANTDDYSAMQELYEKKLSLLFTGLTLVSTLLALYLTVRDASPTGIRAKITKAYQLHATGKKEKAVKEYHQVLKNYIKLPVNEQQHLYPHLTQLFEVLHKKK